MKRKLTVVTDAHGKVLVTQAGHGDVRRGESGILGRVVAGPSQHLHKIEYEVPELHKAADVASFHATLADHLKKTGTKP